MAIELREFHQRHRRAVKRHESSLGELLGRVCSVDGMPAGDDGKCRVCGRQVTEPKPAFVAPPGMSLEQAEAQRLFHERRERQLREREQQETAVVAAKTKTTPERQGRDFSRVFDSSGNVRY